MSAREMIDAHRLLHSAGSGGGSARVFRVAIALACLAFYACRSPSPNGDGASAEGSLWSSSYGDGAADIGTFLMGFREDDIPAGTYVGANTYSVPAGEAIGVTYHALSSLPDDAHLRVTLLVDLGQTAFTVDGQVTLLYDVVLENQVILDLPIVVPALEEGAHDVELVAFINPDNHEVEPEFRFSETYAQSDRFTLLVGDSEEWAPIDLEIAPVFERSDGGSVPMLAFATRSAGSMKAWFEEEVSAGDQLDYYVYTRYETLFSAPNSSDNTFGIVAFLDYLQIPLEVGDDQLVRYYSLDGSAQGIRIEASLTAPESEGQHELCLMRVNHPGHSMAELIGGRISSLAVCPRVQTRTLITVR
jgi:hypothetical protein